MIIVHYVAKAAGEAAAILDAFSRKVVGWAIADHLGASLAIEALDMALAARNPPPMSLIHHSDQGVLGGFKRSSQHDLCRLIGETGQAPLRVSSNQASFGAAS